MAEERSPNAILVHRGGKTTRSSISFTQKIASFTAQRRRAEGLGLINRIGAVIGQHISPPC